MTPDTRSPAPGAEFARQVSDFAAVRPVYSVFAEVLRAVLRRAAKELGLDAIVQARAKETASFAEKMIRKAKRYPDPIHQLTDLCGARVITNTGDQIDAVGNFIRKHFIIDEANSEDVVQRLGAGEFGYRSVHFVVSLREGEFTYILTDLADSYGPAGSEARDVFEIALRRLYESRTVDDVRGTTLSPGPRFKAEIQVRSLLQHAWANFAHDRVYKSEFQVPLRLQREANRVAAMLEEADEAFARTARAVGRYETYYGAYMSLEERQQEIGRLRQVFAFDGDNQRLAHKIARLWISIGEWQPAEQILRPFVQRWEQSTETEKFTQAVDAGNVEDQTGPDDTLERSRDPDMAKVLADYGKSLCYADGATADDFSRGMSLLRWAVTLDPDNVDHYVTLAEIYEEKDRGSTSAREGLCWYERAYATDASEPTALSGYLRSKLQDDCSRDAIPLIRPSLEAGIERCRERARTGVYLPHAHYDIGLFALLLDRPYESLNAFASAVDLSDSDRAVTRHLDRLEALRAAVKGDWPEIDWACRFLEAARVAKLWSVVRKAERHAEIVAHPDDTGNVEGDDSDEAIATLEDARERLREAQQHLKTLAEPHGPDWLAGPVVILPGGVDDNQQILESVAPLLGMTFDDFAGVVQCGGTTDGIGGIVGDLAGSNGSMRAIAYLPHTMPQAVDTHSAYETRSIPGVGFTALQPIHGWVQILAAGIDPHQVRVLGIGGGPGAAFELRAALAFGADVGVVRETGGAARGLTEDEDWSDHPAIMSLPADGETMKIFVQGIPEPAVLDKDTREEMAREAHENYRRERGAPVVHQDPSLSEWLELPEDLRESNRQQIGHIEQKLRKIGMTLERADPGDIEPIEFDDDQVELLAEIEHARWNLERLRSGWVYAEEKDVEKRHTPYLVPWTHLTEEIKKWDRLAVRQIPAMMAERGYRIVPITD